MTAPSTRETGGVRGVAPAGANYALQARKSALRAESDVPGWTVVESREWIEAFTRAGEAEAGSWTAMLERNGVFPPRLKYCLSSDLSAGLKVETLPDEGGEILGRCLEMSQAPPGSTVEAPSAEADENALEALCALCREAGWEAQMRNGTIVTPLDPALQAGPAQMVTLGGAVRVFMDLPHANPEPNVVREARELLLLRLSHLVRLIRPIRRRHGDDVVTELEAAFPRFPTAEQLDHALCALATAARSAAEFHAMEDVHLAGHYLASMRRSAPRTDA
jgi:hypothetical protein